MFLSLPLVPCLDFKFVFLGYGLADSVLFAVFGKCCAIAILLNFVLVCPKDIITKVLWFFSGAALQTEFVLTCCV